MNGVDLIVLGCYSLIGVAAVAKAAYDCFDTFDGDNQEVIMDSLNHRKSFLLDKTESKWGTE